MIVTAYDREEKVWASENSPARLGPGSPMRRCHRPTQGIHVSTLDELMIEYIVADCLVV